jgi:hypothetical protein
VCLWPAKPGLSTVSSPVLKESGVQHELSNRKPYALAVWHQAGHGQLCTDMLFRCEAVGRLPIVQFKCNQLGGLTFAPETNNSEQCKQTTRNQDSMAATKAKHAVNDAAMVSHGVV